MLWKLVHPNRRKKYNIVHEVYGARNRAWAKGPGHLWGHDQQLSSSRRARSFKLDPETIFHECPPSSLSFIPFLLHHYYNWYCAICPQHYRDRRGWNMFSSRRVAITSGIGGKDQTETGLPPMLPIRFAFVYPVQLVTWCCSWRTAKEMHISNFREAYNHVVSRCDEECQQKSMKMAALPGSLESASWLWHELSKPLHTCPIQWSSSLCF
jgi:hypothetical protein